MTSPNVICLKIVNWLRRVHLFRAEYFVGRRAGTHR